MRPRETRHLESRYSVPEPVGYRSIHGHVLIYCYIEAYGRVDGLKKFLIYSVIAILAPLSTACAQLPELLGVVRSDTVHSLFGTQITPTGDQDGDGCSEFMVWGKKNWNYVYYGGDPFDSLPAFVFPNTYHRTSNVGDIDGDTYDELVVSWGPSYYDGRLNLYHGGPGLDTIPDFWFGHDTLHGQGYTVYCDDINGSGTGELVSWGADKESVVLFELGSTPDSTPDLKLIPANYVHAGLYHFGEGLASGDFNGDGRKDLAVSLRPSPDLLLSGWVYLYWGGSDFDTIPDMIVSRPGGYVGGSDFFGNLLVNLGDFNGDGWDDFFAGSGLHDHDTTNFVFFGGPSIDAEPDIVFHDRLTEVNSAGDINNDGHPDLIAGYPMPWSAMGHVLIYFGGPTADGNWDVRIHNDDIQGIQTQFGMSVSGIGDFNGDGIDDFAFSAIDLENRGNVLVFSGWGGGTDVEYEYEPNLPSGYALSQNYPNPFNMSTTVEFSLPRHSEVDLAIYNILGERVRTLIAEDLPVGTYRVPWDGTDHAGRTVASGVYLYELTAGEISFSKKMVVLK